MSAPLLQIRKHRNYTRLWRWRCHLCYNDDGWNYNSAQHYALTAAREHLKWYHS